MTERQGVRRPGTLAVSNRRPSSAVECGPRREARLAIGLGHRQPPCWRENLAAPLARPGSRRDSGGSAEAVTGSSMTRPSGAGPATDSGLARPTAPRDVRDLPSIRSRSGVAGRRGVAASGRRSTTGRPPWTRRPPARAGEGRVAEVEQLHAVEEAFDVVADHHHPDRPPAVPFRDRGILEQGPDAVDHLVDPEVVFERVVAGDVVVPAIAARQTSPPPWSSTPSTGLTRTERSTSVASVPATRATLKVLSGLVARCARTRPSGGRDHLPAPLDPDEVPRDRARGVRLERPRPVPEHRSQQRAGDEGDPHGWLDLRNLVANPTDLHPGTSSFTRTRRPRRS